MEEKQFFNHGNVYVSNSRFMVHGQTYAMNGVTSVKQTVNWPSRGGPIICGLLGCLVLLGMTTFSTILGLLLVGAAVLWWTQQKAHWFVVLSSSSGEIKALGSIDRNFIQGVIDALNQSIIHRG